MARKPGRSIRVAGSRLSAAKSGRLTTEVKQVEAHYRSQAHQDWRLAVLTRAMFRCQQPGCDATIYSGRLYADHIVELSDGGATLDVENGQALCGPCHNRKTMAERARRGAG